MATRLGYLINATADTIPVVKGASSNVFESIANAAGFLYNDGAGAFSYDADVALRDTANTFNGGDQTIDGYDIIFHDEVTGTKFLTTGQPWRIFAQSAAADHVIRAAYNYNGVTQDNGAENSVSFALESSFGGVFEWNLDLWKAGDGTWTDRPFLYNYTWATGASVFYLYGETHVYDDTFITDNLTVGFATGDAGIRLNLKGTLTSADIALGMYTGLLTLTPADTKSAIFTYSGGGTVDTGAANTISEADGHYIAPILKDGTGTITATYAVKAFKSSTGTFNYGIYTDGDSGFGINPEAGYIIKADGYAIFNGLRLKGTDASNTIWQSNATALAITANGGDILFGQTSAVNFSVKSTGNITEVGSTDIQQLTVTGYTTQAVATPLVGFTRNDATAGVSAMLGLTCLGSGANGDGGSIAMAGKSSTTAAQAMAQLDYLWTDATHASRTVLVRGRTTGNAANTGYWGHWNYSAVADTAITVIPNAAGDVTELLTCMYAVAEVTGTDTGGGVVSLAPSESYNICSDATNILTLAVAADGSVTVQRTAGTDTYKVSLWMTWI